MQKSKKKKKKKLLNVVPKGFVFGVCLLTSSNARILNYNVAGSSNVYSIGVWAVLRGNNVDIRYADTYTAFYSNVGPWTVKMGESM